MRLIKKTNVLVKIQLAVAAMLLLACNKHSPLFEELDSNVTGIDFVNQVSDTDSLNILDYLYYYNGGGIAIGDINNDKLPDIYFTANSGSNKLYLNKGNFQFDDITMKAGVAGNADWTTGVSMVDINCDGWLDIYVSTVGRHILPGDSSKVFFPNSANQLFINNQDGTFTEKAAAYGLNQTGYCTQAAFFDYDKDGDLDMFQLHHSIHQTSSYGDTSMRLKTAADGGCRLFENKGGGFEEVSKQAGIYSSPLGYGLAVSIADFNQDGWDDIYVSNDFHENDYYYQNRRNGSFEEISHKAFGHQSQFSMGSDAADINNDGWVDLFTLDMLPQDERVIKSSVGDAAYDLYLQQRQMGYHYQYAKNCLQLNTGGGDRFSDVALYSGVAATDWSWAPLIADFDQDGCNDIFISNGIPKRLNDLDYLKFASSGAGMQPNLRSRDSALLKKMPEGKWHNYFFKGSDSLHFSDKSMEWGFANADCSNGAAYADLDLDGDLDLVVNKLNEPAGIYKNTLTATAATNFLKIKPIGPSKNLFAIGAKAFVFAGGDFFYRQLQPCRGFLSTSEALMHFGLGKNISVDSIIFIWPDNKFQVYTDIKPNQTLHVNYGDAKDNLQNQQQFILQLTRKNNPEKFIDITESTGVDFIHRENTGYVDFSFQPFIPHLLSTAGPRIAVADVNGDGLDDFYVCGAATQSGVLYLQSSGGRFAKAMQAAFLADAAIEQVNAIFFDGDGDGDNDLYVVSGANNFFANQQLLQDAFYLNDGKGQFSKSNSLPFFTGVKSAVCATDFDSDGDMDLFVGGRADSKTYGTTPKSYLLVNDGKGNFSIQSNSLAAGLENIGLVTDAAWADINADLKPDLIVVGEWMPITIFINQNGKLKKHKMAEMPTGLWSSLHITDINDDGKIDIVAGNLGLNSKLKATKKFPLKMYVGDFDSNGTGEQILAIEKGEKYFSFLRQEELERNLPYLRKRYLQYAEMAGKTVEEVFEKKLHSTQLFSAHSLQSMAFINNGQLGFSPLPLPAAFQWQPLFAFYSADFNKDGKKDIVAGGNFFGVSPYEGRYDAMPLWMGLGQPGQANTFATSPVKAVMGNIELRDIKPIMINQSPCLLVAVNNGAIRVLKY